MILEIFSARTYRLEHKPVQSLQISAEVKNAWMLWPFNSAFQHHIGLNRSMNVWIINCIRYCSRRGLVHGTFQELRRIIRILSAWFSGAANFSTLHAPYTPSRSQRKLYSCCPRNGKMVLLRIARSEILLQSLLYCTFDKSRKFSFPSVGNNQNINRRSLNGIYCYYSVEFKRIKN
jgi:hypothetical protein